MKKIGLGIAIILFAILVEVSWTGYFAYLTSGVGVIGLIVTFMGAFGKEEK